MEGRDRDDHDERVIFDALDDAELNPGRPFLKKSAEFNTLAGRMAGFRIKYGVSEADWNLLAGDWISLVLLIQDPSNRVDN